MPEYWLPNPDRRKFRMLALQDDGTYRDVQPADGRFHSTVIDGLLIDPAEIFAGLD